MKKILIILILIFCLNVKVKAQFDVSASSAILMEKDSGRILYGKNINQRYLTASIAKIMTAIVGLEHGDLDEYYKVDEKTTRQYGSSIYLQKGDSVKLIDLIYGLLLRSGNDAAYLIAANVGDSYDDFIDLMNETAKKIGMTFSTFENPSGLDEETQNYSTAYDMALLMAYCLNNEYFRMITGTKYHTSKTKNDNLLYFSNKHRLVQRLDYVTGGKTGFTEAAKRTLVTSAKKNGMELIVVTFNCGDDWNVHTNLFEYGFNHFTNKIILKSQIIKVDEVFYDATPIILYDVKFPLKVDEKIKCIIYLLKDPKDSNIIGKACFYLNNELVKEIDVYRYY